MHSWDSEKCASCAAGTGAALVWVQLAGIVWALDLQAVSGERAHTSGLWTEVLTLLPSH